MQPKPSNSQGPPRTALPLVQAQQAALELTARLDALAMTYALELNKIGFEIWQKQIQNYAALPREAAAGRTAEKALSDHAELIGQSARNYEEGVERIAAAGETMARETAQALDESRKSPEPANTQPKRQRKSGGGARGNSNRGRSARSG